MKTLLSVICFSVGLCVAVSSHAESAAGEESAAARFQQGVELYREGSYEGALAEFRKAYQLSPSYRVLYNIAQAQHALRDFVGAHKSLMQYLGEGGGEITGERRAQVEELANKLADRIAYLQIASNVAGADIRVDDVSVGTSPLPGPIPVNLGTRKVSAVKAGATAVRVVTVAGRERVKVELAVEESAVRTPRPAPAIPAVAVTAKPATPEAPSRAGLIVSASAAAALAVGTGVFGYLALGAQSKFKDQVNAFPNTRDNIEDARNKSRTYGHITDALGAATLISGGLAVYFAITDSHKPKSPNTSVSVGLAPTANGVVLHGGF